MGIIGTSGVGQVTEKTKGIVSVVGFIRLVGQCQKDETIQRHKKKQTKHKDINKGNQIQKEKNKSYIIENCHTNLRK